MNSCSNSSDPFVNTKSTLPYSKGILENLKFAVKDNIDIKNQTTGYGSPDWTKDHYTPVSNAICLEQLLCEGAILKGKTKLDELAYSLLGVNSFYGTPLNPKAPKRIPGGSSSGSASAVASNMVDFAIGTDTGGSVRMPASNCGIWGYRPSHGVISTSGVLPLAPSFDTVGILAKNGKILERVMEVLLAQEKFVNNEISSIFFIDDILKISDKVILQETEAAFKKISTNFKTNRLKLSEITNININFNELFLLLGFLLSTEIWNTFGPWITDKKPKLSQGVEFAIHNYAQSANRNDIQKMIAIQKLFKRNLNRFLGRDKILCFPTTIDLAPKLEEITPGFMESDYIPRAMYVNSVSCLSGTPQITIPLAEYKGIPIGISFIAGYGQDMKLINICNFIYNLCD